MSDADMAQQLAAALNGHEVTNDEGNVDERETSIEESAPQEQTPVEESATAESADETDVEVPKAETEESETDLAQDESGKRYVPEKRFKEIYGKAKATERELQALRAQLAQGNSVLQQAVGKPNSKNLAPKVDKADLLELKMTLPQFNPGSADYSEDLDTLGFQILRANPGMTPLQAGYQALEMAKKIASKVTGVKEEARTVKALQSDQGITNRVTSRQASQVNPDNMSAKELEAYMKQNGMW
jgi:hypothetical protein